MSRRYLRVEITDDCVGSAQCVLLAGDVFVLSDLGRSTVKLAVIPPDLRDATARAAASCPTEAIRLEEVAPEVEA